MIKFSTKAETLERFKPILKNGKVLPLKYFTYKEWIENQDEVKASLIKFFTQHPILVVRSSSMFEDGEDCSYAGGFTSLLNITSIDALFSAIDEVFESFSESFSEKNQVLIQPQLQNVEISGVIFTRDLATLAPYYIINYDDKKKVTDSITSGSSNDLKTYIIFKEKSPTNQNFKKLIECIREIEYSCGLDYLDIEFAIDANQDVFIFQVRPIVIKGKRLPPSKEISNYIQKTKKKVSKIIGMNPYLLGESSILGIMTDWNPAEMIGVSPRPLSISLYKELITDRTWAYQRHNYGYRNLRSFPLLYSLLGIPYIDIRASINSFIPESLTEDIAKKLSSYYLSELKRNPYKHDKIEFDIIFSCYYTGLTKDLQKLEGFNFTNSEIKTIRDHLLSLTKRIIDIEGPFYGDLEKIKLLTGKQDLIFKSELSIIDKIFWLIEDCKRYGTLPFAGIARSAFIATQMLNSFENEALISTKEKEKILRSFNTIAKVILNDSLKLNKNDFLKQYGHLRPGTYDILSPSYEENYDIYFENSSTNTLPDTIQPEELEKILNKIDTSTLEISPKMLYDFIKKSIEGREHSKFIFTRSIHLVLKLVTDLGERFGFSKDDMSYINIKSLLELYSTVDHQDLYIILKDEITRRKNFFEYSKLIKLPDLIMSVDEVDEFLITEVKPNFITLGKCRGEVLTEENIQSESLQDKIVFIEKADPGYDWIFGKNIKGLVTMYGGANSHMSIRANELNIPGVIGCGEKNYRTWSKAHILDVDCENKIVKVLK